MPARTVPNNKTAFCCKPAEQKYIIQSKTAQYPMNKISKKISSILAIKLGWLLFLLLGKLTRIRVEGQEYWDQLENSDRGFLVILWHGRIFLPIFHHRNQGVVAMVSQHGDGEMIARTVRKLGFTTVRGSSTRGGQKALRALVRELKQGKVGTMMPDGPRGPRHELKSGAIYIAQLARVPLLPMTFSAFPAIQFKSWDKFLLARPFSRSVVMYGEPIEVPPRMNPDEFEIFRKELESRLIKLEQNADEYLRK